MNEVTPDSGQGTRSFYFVSWPFTDAAGPGRLGGQDGLPEGESHSHTLPPMTLLNVLSTETLAHFSLLQTIQKHMPSNLLNERKQK